MVEQNQNEIDLTIAQRLAKLEKEVVKARSIVSVTVIYLKEGKIISPGLIRELEDFANVDR
jgi:hypothetical protein